jgi:hypothetical protein
VETVDERDLVRRYDPDPAEPADPLEPSYQESVRRYNRRRQEEHRWEWIRYFDRMAALHARLAAEHAARAESLFREGGEEPP